MPSSTRQATPGPSSTLVESRRCLLSTPNTKKRAGSEGVEDARHNKKIKVDGEPLSNLSMNAKDKKKKKKKKKKRISVVVPEIEHKKLTSKSRTPPNKPASVVKMETPANGPVDNTRHTVQNEDPPPKSSNKGKGKARSNSPTSQVSAPAISSVAYGSEVSNVILPHSINYAPEIARLKEQVTSQNILLQRYKVHLTQHQQALTCQICLDLMYKPFALAPCGHITCYNCLIRWFTALQNPNAAGVASENANPLPENVDEIQLIVNSAEARRGTYLRRRKTCPVCRAAVLQRPVEMWGIKAMVAALVNSELVDLSVPMISPNSTGDDNNGDANSDPWRHIFKHINILYNTKHGPLPQDRAVHEHLGLYDDEDGGIYRCIDCLHEIWGGVCSGCNRGYPGHERNDDDDDDDGDINGVNNFLQLGHQARHLVQALENDDEEDGYDQFWDEEDEDHAHGNLHHHPVYPAQGYEYLFLSGDEGLTDSEGQGENIQDLGSFDPFHPVFIGSPPLGGIARIDEGSDEELRSDYGGSFIDDDNEGEVMDDQPEVIELDASSDEELGYLPQTRIRQMRRPLASSEDEENLVDLDDGEAILNRGRRTRNPARRHPAVLLTDDARSSGEESDHNEEESAGEEDGQMENLSRSRARPRTWIVFDDE